MSNLQSGIDRDNEGPSRLGRFIQTYHSFLSSFVIGAAGLIATSIWQYKQSEIARRQAESQQQIAITQAENSWRIERAEILSKNLQVLATTGGNTMEQRYGVLLSLTRGNLLDAELAVSYALELGKDNADYMQSVLANTTGKDYARLASAFEPTCEQRFGVSRDVLLCKADAHATRSEAIAELFNDETETARKKRELGPCVLLQDEREVQGSPARLAWLFTPYLTSLYDRRQWKEIESFEAQSNGARLVSALVLGPARKHELVATSDVRDVDKFHDSRAGWLVDYLLRPTCDAECKGKLTDSMLTAHANALGRYDSALRTVLGRTRDEVANVFGRMHARLLACQLQTEDVPELRDNVLVPALSDELAKPKADPARVEELLSLLALVPEPEEGAAAPSDFKVVLTRARDFMGDKFKRSYTARRSAAEGLRQNPPQHARKSMFCSAGQLVSVPSEFDE
jgi:hypothetical protein